MIPDGKRSQIRLELDELRKNGTRRQELSLHACKRLFFDFNIRPSMTTVRDLTQTGSASDIPKDIELFWQRIRTASKVRINTGTIPAKLEEKAGELFSQLFDAALAQAHEALDCERTKIQATQQKVDQNAHDTEVRRIAINEMLQRNEGKTEVALEQIRKLEAQLATSTTHAALQHDKLMESIQRLEAKNDELQKNINTEQMVNVTLRKRIKALHEEMRKNTEHYAQQIKEALAEAERRVKPMLVELDSLRSMASTWQAAQHNIGHKEFDLAQQLIAAKTKNSQLDATLCKHVDEIDTLTRQISTLRNQHTINPVATEVLYMLAFAGRLDGNDFTRIGTLIDNHVTVPSHCPHCHEGEPELLQVGQEYEIFCPVCNRSSGTCLSRLEAAARFMATDSDNLTTTHPHDPTS